MVLKLLNKNILILKELWKNITENLFFKKETVKMGVFIVATAYS
jgi:hypothetical protein